MPENASTPWRISLATLGLLYVQIILGALLRHPGTGIDPVLVVLHICGAIFVTIAIAYLFQMRIPKVFETTRVLYPAVRFFVMLVQGCKSSWV